MQVNPDIQQQIRAWRDQESKYYAAALSEAELYMVGIQLVRAIANNLRTINSLEELIDYYRGLDVQYVLPIADALDSPLAVFLDYASALGAAFYVRTQEIREENIQRQARERILAASRTDQQWVTLYHDETLRNGITFFWHLEMNLRNGIGLQTACELDLQKGRVYVLELLVLNLETGRVCRDIKLPDSKYEFTAQAELTAAIAELRQKYAATEVNHGACL
ncbi:MAG: hypothetical protein L0154_21610 [Chloroflexi bacterium]|nr:hypothetical protein [Chloroflexota bacterium]